MTAENSVGCFAAGITADNEHLIFNRSRLCQRNNMRCSHKRPLRHHKEHVNTPQCKTSDKLAKADIVADYDSALMSVKLEGHKIFAEAEELVLVHRSEEMRLVIFRNNLALTVENKRRVVNFTVLLIGNTAGNDIDFKLLCQISESLFCPLAVLVAKACKVLFRIEAGCPRLGKNNNVGFFFFYRLPYKPESFGVVILNVAELHIKLNAGNSHLIIHSHSLP